MDAQQTQPGQQMTKAERKQLRRQEKQAGRAREERAARMRKVLMYALGWGVVLAGAGFFIWKVATAPTVAEDDVLASNGIHWHAELSIQVDGAQTEVPGNLGLAGAVPGAHPENMHTHDSDGVIHIEKRGVVTKEDTKLKHFFEVWGEQFTGQCIFESCTEDAGTLTMLVNGQENTSFEQYELRDGDRVEIVFERSLAEEESGQGTAQESAN